LNGLGGENSDLGDPIYAIADGRVLLACDGGPGWGNVMIVLHAYVENGERKYVQSYYGHIERMLAHPATRPADRNAVYRPGLSR
jgi:murein DD-endopeptidase MepM/ murein hydrolase activator NlpD